MLILMDQYVNILSILSGCVVNIQHQHLVRVKSTLVVSLKYSAGGKGEGGGSSKVICDRDLL